MAIQVGDKLPEHTFSILAEEGMQSLTTADLFSGKKVVLFAVPGAFTPTCSEAHLPGFVTLSDKFQEAGIDAIYCLSVNDAFVMAAWAKSQNAEDITMLADGDAGFSKSLGLDMNTDAFGGVRSQRFAMIVDDGEVKVLNIEEPKAFEVSKADVMLAAAQG